MNHGFGKGEGLLLISGALWGTAYVAMKIGLADGDPYLFALLRFVLGSTVLLGVVLALGRFKPGLLKDPLMWAIGLLNALCIVLQNVGMTMTTATNTALLFNMNVAVVAILAAVMLKERLSRRGLFGLFVGMAGAVLVSTNGNISGFYSGTFQGDLLILASTVLWAFCAVYLKKMLNRGEDAVMVTTGMFTTSAACLVPIVLLFTSNYYLSTTGWEVVIWIGLVCTGMAYLAYNLGLGRVSVTVAAIISLSESVFALFFAFLLLNEAMSAYVIMGGALLAASILILSAPQPRGSGGEGEPPAPAGSASKGHGSP